MKNRKNERGIPKTDLSLDKPYAMLAVLAQKNSKCNRCPDSETMAAFIEGRLSGPKRKIIMGHLVDCAECRRQWLLVGSASPENCAPESAWLKQFFYRIKKIALRRFFVSGGFSLAMAAALILIILLPRQHNELQQLISKSYTDLPASDAARFNSFAVRGETNDPEEALPEMRRAYQAGMNSGKALLLKKSGVSNKMSDKTDSADAPQSLLFSMGQWIVLLQCSCISSGPTYQEFWDDQAVIARRWRSEYRPTSGDKATTQEILKTVTLIQNSIDHISQTGDKADGCEEISFNIEAIENILR